MKIAVLIVNVGTPDKPKLKYVSRFLFKFLNDRHVIDLPWLFRKVLVNLIIIPFRVRKSTKLYKLLWSIKSSPLIHYTLKLKEKLQLILPDNYTVFIAMRYGNPSLKFVLQKIYASAYDKIIVIPQFPQYADSTTGTVNYFIMKEVKKWGSTPSIQFINEFYSNPGFINSFAELASENNYKDFDHILFSFHGLPIRHINKVHPEIDCNTCSCTIEMPKHGAMCYKASCYHTSRLLAQKLGLNTKQYTVSFQSRLSKNWIEPFSDKVIIEKAQQGVKRILVLAPSFVVDCLETEVEIGLEYAKLFKVHGGEELVMAKSLNDSDKWINTLKDIALNTSS